MYAEFVEDVKDMLKARAGVLSLRELCRSRGWPKARALQYLSRMQESGLVVVRRWGRTTFILDAARPLCGCCAKFGTSICEYRVVKPDDEADTDEGGCFLPLVGLDPHRWWRAVADER